MILVLARHLGRTRAELLTGGAGHRPLSHAEWVDWLALFDLEAKELEMAQRKASKPRKSAGGDAPRTLQRARAEG